HDGTEPTSLTAPRQSAPRPQILLPSAATSPQPLERYPQLRRDGRSPATTCSRDHNHCVRKKAAWIGDMYFGLGSSKGAIFEHLYQLPRISSSHGVHYDQVHSGAMMIVTEDISCRSNRYVSTPILKISAPKLRHNFSHLELRL
uniref:Uncharacterized protein n=1 Tax=Triticum urartu TaxID=4572 RepID=A0A8R7PKT2_TRIUA